MNKNRAGARQTTPAGSPADGRAHLREMGGAPRNPIYIYICREREREGDVDIAIDTQ